MKIKILISSICVLFCTVQLCAQAFEWGYKFGGATSDEGSAITVDANNYTYITGSFELGADFDPGTGVAYLNAQGSSDIFIQKFNEAGYLLWAKRIGGSGADAGRGITTDYAGNIYITGQFSTSVDFDPGTGTHFLSSVGDGDAFVLKLDKNGNFVWVKQIGSTDTDCGLAISVDPQGNVYASGWFSETINFTAGNGNNVSFTSTTGWDGYAVKFTEAGVFKWCTPNSSTAQDRSRAIVCDPGNAVYVSGDRFVEKLDLFTGQLIWNLPMTNTSSGTSLAIDREGYLYATGYLAGTMTLTDTTIQSNNSGAFILKLDSDGNCNRCRIVAGSIYVWGFSIVTDKHGNIYTTGYFRGDADFDPGAGTTIFSSPDNYSGFILKLDANENFVWAKVFQSNSSSNSVESAASAIDQNGNLITTGRFHGVADFKPAEGHLNLTANGFFDMYLIKLSSTAYYKGKVFYDLNADQIQEANEPGVPNAIIEATPSYHFANTNQEGAYRIYDDIVSDTVRPYISQAHLSVQPDFIVVDTATQELNFAVQATPFIDVCIAMAEYTPFARARNTCMAILVSNIGLAPVSSVPVELTLVPHPVEGIQVEYVSSDLPPASVSSDLITWTIPSIGTNETYTINVCFHTDANAHAGDLVTLSASAPLQDDIATENNGTRLESLIRGSFDPNFKEVWPAIATPTQLDTTALTYIVHFQNTGTYQADLVIIRDTLPTSLDLRTLKMMGASHAYTWNLREDHILEARFDPIALPDSNANEPGSHGFLIFSAYTKKGLVYGDSVSNRVGIYFDYNAPVITNNAVMHIPIPVSVSNPRGGGLEFGLSPNPVAAQAAVNLEFQAALTGSSKQLYVYDVLGKQIQTQTAMPGQQRLTVKGLAPGTYVVQVISGNQSGYRVLVVR